VTSPICWIFPLFPGLLICIVGVPEVEVVDVDVVVEVLVDVVEVVVVELEPVVVELVGVELVVVVELEVVGELIVVVVLVTVLVKVLVTVLDADVQAEKARTAIKHNVAVNLMIDDFIVSFPPYSQSWYSFYIILKTWKRIYVNVRNDKLEILKLKKLL
jgi:hypothetical protein